MHTAYIIGHFLFYAARIMTVAPQDYIFTLAKDNCVVCCRFWLWLPLILLVWMRVQTHLPPRPQSQTYLHLSPLTKVDQRFYAGALNVLAKSLNIDGKHMIILNAGGGMNAVITGHHLLDKYIFYLLPLFKVLIFP